MVVTEKALMQLNRKLPELFLSPPFLLARMTQILVVRVGSSAGWQVFFQMWRKWAFKGKQLTAVINDKIQTLKWKLELGGNLESNVRSLPSSQCLIVVFFFHETSGDVNIVFFRYYIMNGLTLRRFYVLWVNQYFLMTNTWNF